MLKDFVENVEMLLIHSSCLNNIVIICVFQL